MLTASACASHRVPAARQETPSNVLSPRSPAVLQEEDEEEEEEGEADGGPASFPNSIPASPDSSVPAEHHPFQDVVNSVSGRSAPAARYANLMPAACRAELRRRKLPFKSTGGPASGITTPLRFDGPLAGVHFVVPGKKSVYGKLDCRLALALDDLAQLLARHHVTEVRVDNLYRPHAHLPGKRKPSQHSYGLAVDLVGLVLADGRTLVVESDWRGAIGDAPCGPDSAPREPTENTVDLRNVVCDVARAGLFHHLLTPNFNAAHENHLHFDIKRDDARTKIE